MGFSALVAGVDRMVRTHLGGTTVTYRPGSGGDAVQVAAMFDERFVEVRRDDASVEQVAPAIFVRLEDLPTDPADDDPTITIGDQDYHVREREPDGLGGIRLLLHEVDPVEAP